MLMQGYLLSRPIPADQLMAAITGMPARMELLIEETLPVITDQRLTRLRRIR